MNEKIFNPRGLLHELKEMMKLRAQKKALSLMVEISPDMPRLVQTDETKLRQVLVNLIGNAVKFTDDGIVTVRVRADRGDSPMLHFEKS